MRAWLILPFLMLSAPAGAASCDALTTRVIRITGASLAGRAEPGAVFRAADADRMSLDCRMPARIVIGSLDRRPSLGFFTLIGLAAEALGRAGTAEAQSLALRIHQDSLLQDAPQQGAVGALRLRCETGPRADSLAGYLSVCVVEAERGALRRKAALPRSRRLG